MNKTRLSIMVCGLAFCMTVAQSLAAQTFSVMHSFDGTDGSSPGPLVQGVDGNMYGTTYSGGANNMGSLYVITPGGTFTTLYSFCSLPNCADGSYPQSQLTLGFDGSLYGTTDNGGDTSVCLNACGTVFRYSNGTLTTLHDFVGPLLGFTPQGGLVQGVDGNFYGTTLNGGTVEDGTIFKMAPSGKFGTLLNFDYTDGYVSYATPMQSINSPNLYGVTYAGGAWGVGEVYEITPAGLNVIFSFRDLPAGNHPIGGLTTGKNGNLYGVSLGGANNDGTFYSVSTTGAVHQLYTFDGTHGGNPFCLPSLALGPDGNFYGTTTVGGAYNDGTIFSITPQGVYTDLHDFDGADGNDTVSGLTEATDGTFYGTSPVGGANDQGSVFHLSTGLPAFVQPVPAFGTAASTIMILGSNLTGTTSVTFNGVAASFTVVSATEITATIPSGSTSGKLQVVTPGGTLASKLNFWVMQ